MTIQNPTRETGKHKYAEWKQIARLSLSVLQAFSDSSFSTMHTTSNQKGGKEGLETRLAVTIWDKARVTNTHGDFKLYVVSSQR